MKFTSNRFFHPIRLFVTALALSGLFTFSVSAEHNTPEALEARVSSEGKLNIVDTNAPAISDSSATNDGESVYSSTCAVCHGAGIAGAPKTGDAASWEARIAQGVDMLISHAVQGFQGETGFMPAKGGNPSLSDDEVAAAVNYMLKQLK